MKPQYILLLAATLLFSCSKEKSFIPIAPPFEAVSIPADTASFDPSKPKVLNLSGGSSVEVPANAFVDRDGNLITEPVTLSCREIKSAADIVVSGIPMTFTDESGEQQQFKSAGMFDIRGTAGGKEIFIADDKSIKVNFASPVQGEYDLFYLEEEQAQTDSAGIIPAAMAQNPAPSLSQGRWIRLTDNAEKAPEPDSLDSFTLTFDTAQYPEAKVLQGISWKIKKGETNNPLAPANSAVLDEKWQQVSLTKPEKRIDVVKSFPGLHMDEYNETGHFITKDSTGFSLYNADGKKVRSYPGFSDADFLTENSILFKGVSHYLVTDVNGNDLFKGSDETVEASQDGNFICYTRASMEKDAYIHFRNSAGKIIRKESMPLRVGNNWYIYFVRSNEKFVCLTKEDGLHVYDYAGKPLGHLNKDVSVSKIMDNGDIVYTENSDGNNSTVNVWDWKKQKFYICPEHPVVPYSTSERNGVIQFTENDKLILWNYLEDRLITLPSTNYIYSDFGLKSPFTITSKEVEGAKKLAIYNNEGKELTAGFDLEESSNREASWFAQTNTSIVIKSKAKGFLLLDNKGNVIKNLSEIDSSLYTFNWWPVGDNEFAGWSRSGRCYIFNAEGEVVSNFMPAGISFFILKDTVSGTYLTNVAQLAQEYSAKGRLHYDLGHLKRLAQFPGNKSRIRCLGYKDHLELIKPGADLESGFYQLNLSSASKTFRTYVYLTDEDLSKFNRYQKKLSELKEKDEHRKQKEYALLRSFEAKKFGVYNYDIKYKNNNRIALAADFTFEGVSGNLDITVFQIAGAEKNVVIRFDKSSWSEFSFDPAEPTVMIAVLPDDHIAIFDEKDFGNLNTEILKKEKKYTFKMRTLGKVESVEMLKKLLNKPV